MNKTTKVALCISLAGIGVLAWPHVAAARKPVAPVVTFISGDVISAPQSLGGPFTAAIDFAKYIPYICPDSPPGGEAVLRYLQTRNPITYDSLKISASDTNALYSRLDFKVTIDGIRYTVTMNAFLSSEPTEVTPTLKTYHWREGRFAVQSGNTLLVVAGTPVRQVNLDFSMTR